MTLPPMNIAESFINMINMLSSNGQSVDPPEREMLEGWYYVGARAALLVSSDPDHEDAITLDRARNAAIELSGLLLETIGAWEVIDDGALSARTRLMGQFVETPPEKNLEREFDRMIEAGMAGHDPDTTLRIKLGFIFYAGASAAMRMILDNGNSLNAARAQLLLSELWAFFENVEDDDEEETGHA